MNIFPAIDLKDKNVVRLLRGDYNNMTVYGNNPL
ncbi:MAG: HisA/HisF-related TIM barrel protein, partial [Clostridia bacterium]|nr:HisA/HisF-related TIM barrel protein [Clostridia bacterium]